MKPNSSLPIPLFTTFFFHLTALLTFILLLPSAGITQINEKDNLSGNYLNFLIGKFKPDTSRNFVLVANAYSQKSNLFLQKETYNAFVRMAAEAKKSGITLSIISGTRNFEKQKQIWEGKWIRADFAKFKEGKERAMSIMKFSSMPGTSRHHWGTDIDLNALKDTYFQSSEGKKMYEWMNKNAIKFGFCQVFSNKNQGRPNGYETEKWHWSYIPLAEKYTIDYAKLVKPEHITGFKGNKAFIELDVIRNYVLGINPECRK